MIFTLYDKDNKPHYFNKSEEVEKFLNKEDGNEDNKAIIKDNVLSIWSASNSFIPNGCVALTEDDIIDILNNK